MSDNSKSQVNLTQDTEFSLNKTIFRSFHNRENPYVTLNKTPFFDPDLSVEAVGLWGKCMTRPDDWEFNINEMCRSTGCGIKKLYRILKELIAAGYAYRYTVRKPNGLFERVFYCIFEFKVSPEDLKKFLPHSPKRRAVKAHQLSNESKLNKKNKDKDKECAHGREKKKEAKEVNDSKAIEVIMKACPWIPCHHDTPLRKVVGFTRFSRQTFEAAHEICAKRWSSKKPIKKPNGYLFSVCETVRKQNNEELNYQIISKLRLEGHSWDI